jgi:hypothetical protein
MKPGPYWVRGFDPNSGWEKETGAGGCACGRYIVSHQYHWHSYVDNRCHNKVACGERCPDAIDETTPMVSPARPKAQDPRDLLDALEALNNKAAGVIDSSNDASRELMELAAQVAETTELLRAAGRIP